MSSLEIIKPALTSFMAADPDGALATPMTTTRRPPCSVTQTTKNVNLFYVPTGPTDPLVDFSGMSAADQTALFAFLDETGLSEFAGQISPRNEFKNPWFHDLDFRFQQELPGVRKQDRAFFFVDIENLLNLVDDSLNNFREHDNGDVGEAVPVLDAACSDATCSSGQFIYTNFNPGGRQI